MREVADSEKGEGVDALRARNTRKTLLFAAVACAHALVIALLLSESHTFQLPGANVVPIQAILLAPAQPHPPRPFPAGRLRRMAAPVRPITEPITLSVPAVGQPLQIARPINWALAARQAVHAALRRSKSVAIGFPAGARSHSALHSAASGIRSQGRESYTTRTGQRVYRTGGNCYLESGPPPLDATQLEQQAQMSRVACSSSGGHGPSPDNLFKSLPAYKRYHSLPPLAVHPGDRARLRRQRPRLPPPP